MKSLAFSTIISVVIQHVEPLDMVRAILNRNLIIFDVWSKAFLSNIHLNQ